jgi:hypothetical protein
MSLTRLAPQPRMIAIKERKERREAMSLLLVFYVFLRGQLFANKTKFCVVEKVAALSLGQIHKYCSHQTPCPSPRPLSPSDGERIRR